MAEAKPKKTTSTKKIVDVKSDGDGASGTSRPVLVSNRPILKDPMMAEISQLTGGLVEESEQPTAAPAPKEKPVKEKGADGAPELATPQVAKTTVKEPEPKPEKAEEKSATPPSKKKIIIKPLTAEEHAESEATETDKKDPTVADLAKPDPLPEANSADKNAVTDAKAVKDPQPSTAEEPAKTEEASAVANTEPAVPVQPGRSFDEATETSETATDDVEQIELDEKGKPKKQTKKSGSLSSEQRKAIESGEYLLPITTAETRRMRREILFATLFVVILTVVWLDIMLDAELLNLGGIKALTDFF